MRTMRVTAQPVGGHEHIEQAYKGLPLWRTAAWLLLHFTGIPVTLMFGWYTFAFYYLEGKMHPQDLSVTLTFVFYVLAVIVWKLARPATTLESLTMTKAASLCVVVVLALKVIHAYKYHIVDLKQFLFPRRLWKHLSEEEGFTSSYWLPFFTFWEALGDGGVLVCAGLTLFCFQHYIAGKMAHEKRLKLAKETKDAPAAPSSSKEEGSSTGGKPATPGGAKKRRGRA